MISKKTELLAQLIEKIDIVIPDPLVDQYVQQTLQNVKRQLENEHKTPEEAGIDMDTLPVELRKDVIQQTKQSWIFETIAEKEGIFVSDDELESEIRRAAEQQNRDAQKYAALLKSSNRLEDFRGAAATRENLSVLDSACICQTGAHNYLMAISFQLKTACGDKVYSHNHKVLTDC